MPRLVEAIPKYRKHRATGQAVVTLGGKDHYLGPHRSKASKILYDRLIAQWLAGGRSLPADSDDEAITVATLLAEYLTFAEGYYVKNGEPTNGEYDGLELRTFNWDVASLEVGRVESSLFSDASVFPTGSVEFDCALLMRGIEHEWHGRESLKAA